ncbi:capsular polysaccharide export protein [Cognatiyoonia koreensis]|uniref:Capsular polysaccharide export protein n=1 Tax=Cognatiyoonia koreensis TaxID=364200 RepID=A0A1I0NIU3_9RHOB|nr:hypothetical protein [Cognatiyoonia koreensis]SEW01393.1 capsular polysaccharide export protein [Cognatiyoonia koreensis]
MPIVWLKEPHAEKERFFQAIGESNGRALRTWPVSFQHFPETNARAAACLARAKKQPKSAVGYALKLAFLKGRYNWARRYFAAHPDDLALCWQGLTGTRRVFMEGARDAGAARLFSELAPLPGYKTLDPEGVNAESSVPRVPSFFDDVTPDPALLDQIRGKLTARESRRKDVGQGQKRTTDCPYLFVPLQVPDDSQMVLFAGWVGSMEGFINAIATAARDLPDGWHLRLKEHPSSRIRLTDQINALIADGARLELDNETDSFAQLRASRGVLTCNSSMGLQAMFHDVPVITTGRCFYAMRGLTKHAGDAATLRDLMGRAPALQFDPEFRARFLTWLAKDYYIGETEKGFDQDAIKKRIAEARACSGNPAPSAKSD